MNKSKNNSSRHKLIYHAISILAFLGLAVFFFWPFVSGSSSFLWDTREFGYPNFHLVSSFLSDFKFPLWNPLRFSGYPAAGDIEMSMFYPVQWIFTAIFAPQGGVSFHGLSYYFVFHFFLGAVFAYLLSYKLTKNIPASFLGAIVFAYSGYALGHISHLGQVIMYMWIPAVFYTFIIAFEKKQWLYTLLAGTTFGIAMLVGHYNTTVYIALGLFILFLYRLFARSGRLRTILHAAAAIVFSVMISAVMIFPVAELALQSTRAELTYEQQSEDWSLNPFNLFGLFSSNYNHVLDESPLETFDGSVDITQNYFYIGLLPLILIIFGLFSKNRYKWFFVILGLISLFAAGGKHTPVNWFLFYTFPGFNKARMAVQIMCMSFFAASAMTAIGAQKFFSVVGGSKIRKFSKYIIPLVCIVAMGDIFYHGWNKDFYSEKISPEEVYDLDEEITLTNSLKDSTEDLFRISDEALVLSQSKWEYYGIENIWGNGGIKINRYNDLFEKTDRLVSKPIAQKLYNFLNVKYIFEENSTAPKENTEVLPRAYLVKNFQILPLDQHLALISNDDVDFYNEVLLEEEPICYGDLSDPLSAKPEVRFTEKTANHMILEVSNPSDAILVMSELDYNGWKLKVDGQKEKYITANYAFRAVPLVAGTHTVEFTYKPLSVYAGAGVSIASLLTLLVLISIRLIKPAND